MSTNYTEHNISIVHLVTFLQFFTIQQFFTFGQSGAPWQVGAMKEKKWITECTDLKPIVTVYD